MKYNIRFVSTYDPKKCGIAIYTRNLMTGCSAHGVFGEKNVTAILGDEASELYSPPVDIKIKQDNPESWKQGIFETVKTAKARNEILVLQHEFGIAWCEDKDYFVELAKEARNSGLTVITYLHTVESDPEPYYIQTLQDLDKFSDRLVVHTRSGKERLEGAPYSISDDHVEVIPHGVRYYHPRTLDRLAIKRKRGLENILLLSSFGLRGPGKGNEHAIKAYAKYLESLSRKQKDHVVFGIFGTCHENYKKLNGGEDFGRFEEMIRDTLSDTKVRTPGKYAKELDDIDWTNNDIVIYDRFLDENELLQFYCATNLMLMLYPGKDQTSSGILADGMGTGTATIATLFDYAKEVLYDGEVPEGFWGLDPKKSRGALVNIKDASIDEAAEMIRRLTKEEGEQAFRGRDARLALEKRSLEYGYGMRWPNAAWKLYQLIEETEEGRERITGRGVLFRNGDVIINPSGD